MAIVQVRIVIPTVWITLSVYPFNCIAHTANTSIVWSPKHCWHWHWSCIPERLQQSMYSPQPGHLRNYLLHKKLARDRHGHLSLEPVCFTSSILNQKPKSGYIPNIGVMSKAKSTHTMKSLGRSSYIMIFYPKSLVPFLISKAKKEDCLISFLPWKGSQCFTVNICHQDDLRLEKKLGTLLDWWMRVNMSMLGIKIVDSS
jgi:hypothetical protein